MLQLGSRDIASTSPAQAYGLVVLATFAAAVATVLLREALIFSNDGLPPMTLFLVSVAFSAWYGGRGPGLLSIVLGLSVGIFLFKPSPSAFDIADGSTQSRVFLYLVASGLMMLISEGRNRAERLVRLQRSELRVTLESIGDAVIAADDQRRVIFLNPVAEKLTGWSSGEALGLPLAQVFQIVNEETHGAVENPAERVLREGIVVGLANHTSLIARDGSEVPIDDSAAPIRNAAGRIGGVVLVFHDVSERRRIERERQALLAAEQTARHSAEQAQERFAFLADASATLSAALDYNSTLQAVATLAVPRLADWCGTFLLQDGQLQQVALEHTDPGKVDAVHQMFFPQAISLDSSGILGNVVKSGRSIFLPDFTAQTPLEAQNEIRTQSELQQLGIRSVIIAPLNVRGRTLGAIVFAQAESGRRYSTADLALAEDLARRAAVAIDNAALYLEAQNAIALRDQFLSVASHELKTPLTSLIGYAQILQRRARRDNSLSERDLHSLQMVVQQSFRLNQLILGVLDVSRLQAGQLSIERKEMDLGTLVRRVVDETQPMLTRHQLDLRVPDEPLPMQGDALRLEQVLENLIQNAVKYSPEGGAIEVNLTREGDQAVLAVTDHGIGIPAEALPQLFTRFYRAPNVEQRAISGMGIGLYVVKEIISLHGGSVEVQSTEGSGSTFTVRLPLDGGISQEQAPAG